MARGPAGVPVSRSVGASSDAGAQAQTNARIQARVATVTSERGV
jgi:hypothetical protein